MVTEWGLMDIMEPAIQLRDQENIEKGLKKGLKREIQVTIDILRELGHGNAEIKTAIMKNVKLHHD